METTEITDLYQASYLLLNGCTLEGVECIPMAGSLGCKITFAGVKVGELSLAWFEKKAVVNLWAFRGAYNQINSYLHQAKKNYVANRRRAEDSQEAHR